MARWRTPDLQECRRLCSRLDHPLQVLAPERAPKMLLSHKDKIELLRSLGVDVVMIQHFDLQFAKLAAEEFVRVVLLDRLKAAKIWVGKDLRFGQGRKGGVDDLLRWGTEAGFQVGIVEPILVDGVRVSDSRIRQLITDGKVDGARSLLGRYHFVSGRVVTGHQRGHDLGFPTATFPVAPKFYRPMASMRHYYISVSELY